MYLLHVAWLCVYDYVYIFMYSYMQHPIFDHFCCWYVHLFFLYSCVQICYNTMWYSGTKLVALYRIIDFVMQRYKTTMRKSTLAHNEICRSASGLLTRVSHLSGRCKLNCEGLVYKRIDVTHSHNDFIVLRTFRCAEKIEVDLFADVHTL